MLRKPKTQKKIKEISSYLEEHYPFLYQSVGGRRVRKILREIVFKKKEIKRENNKNFSLTN